MHLMYLKLACKLGSCLSPSDAPGLAALSCLLPVNVRSAILNALLTLLNERLFDNGNQRLPVPLLCLVGASNELPESEELDALYDRFLIRRTVAQVCMEGAWVVQHFRSSCRRAAGCTLLQGSGRLGATSCRRCGCVRV